MSLPESGLPPASFNDEQVLLAQRAREAELEQEREHRRKKQAAIRQHSSPESLSQLLDALHDAACGSPRSVEDDGDEGGTRRMARTHRPDVQAARLYLQYTVGEPQPEAEASGNRELAVSDEDAALLQRIRDKYLPRKKVN